MGLPLAAVLLLAGCAPSNDAGDHGASEPPSTSTSSTNSTNSTTAAVATTPADISPLLVAAALRRIVADNMALRAPSTRWQLSTLSVTPLPVIEGATITVTSELWCGNPSGNCSDGGSATVVANPDGTWSVTKSNGGWVS